MPNRRQTLKLLGVMALGLVNGGVLAQSKPSGLKGLEAVVYKAPACNCCGEYANFLKEHGVKVRVVLQDDLGPIKARYRIPAEAQSCHTVQIEGYVVEGHVPLGALQKLFRERPKIDGIALPGMPIGTPGMPGSKTEPYRVLSLKNGQLTPFATF